MLVTVVTISFNQGRYLERALQSVLAQSHPHIEYIVVDAGSTDGSLKILERYRHVLAELVIEPDRGPADGLNKGLARASGEVFGYLNADDMYERTAVAEAVAHLKRSTAAAVVGDGVIVDSEGAVLRPFRSTPITLRGYAYGSSVAMQQATFVRTAAVRSVGGFNAKNQTCWDGELLVDLLLEGRQIELSRRPWGVFRHHDASISTSGESPEYLRDQARLFQKAMGRPPRRADEAASVVARIFKHARDPIGASMRLMAAMNRSS